jgi:hypothetical protein
MAARPGREKCIAWMLPIIVLLMATSILPRAFAVEEGEVSTGENRDGGEESKDARERSESNADGESSRPTGVVTSDELFHTHESSGQSLMFEAQNAKRSGDMERAITLIRRSLDADDNDLDAHCFYAEMLESKLKKQVEKDPEAFRTCVKEWLLVLRNEVGEEKGLNFHGIGFMGTFYEDEEHTIKARQHLVKLTGASPKGWESDSRYLKRVLTKSAEEVSGKVVKPKKASPKSEDAQVEEPLFKE